MTALRGIISKVVVNRKRGLVNAELSCNKKGLEVRLQVQKVTLSGFERSLSDFASSSGNLGVFTLLRHLLVF